MALSAREWIKTKGQEARIERAIENGAYATVTRDCRYVYATSVDVEVEDPEEDLPEGLNQQLKEWVWSINALIEKELYEDLEFLTSDEMVLESLDAVDMKFDPDDGTMLRQGLPEGVLASDLSRDLRDEVIERYRHWNVEDPSVLEMRVCEPWVTRLEKWGFDKPDIAFSLSYRQGDGASFTSKYVDLRLALPAMSRKAHQTDEA